MRSLDALLQDVARLCTEMAAELEGARMPGGTQREGLRVCAQEMRTFPQVQGLVFVLTAAAGWLDTAEEEGVGQNRQALEFALGQMQLAKREVASALRS